MTIPLSGSIASELILILLIFIVLYIIFKLGKGLFGLVINVVLGFISIFVLNAVFSLGISFSIIVLIITAVLGLPGVAIIVVLKLIGISL